MGTWWKPEVLSLKEERCSQAVNWQYPAPTCSSGSRFVFSAELGAEEHSGCTGMLALCQPAMALAIALLIAPALWDADCLLHRKNRGQTGSYFSLPTVTCNIIICFVVTNAKANKFN